MLAVGELGCKGRQSCVIARQHIEADGRLLEGAMRRNTPAPTSILLILADVEGLETEAERAIWLCKRGAVERAGLREATIAVAVVELEGTAQDAVVVGRLHFWILHVLLLVVRPLLVGAVEDAVVVVLHLEDGPRGAALAIVAVVLLEIHLADTVLLARLIGVVVVVEHAIHLVGVLALCVACAGHLWILGVVVEADVVGVEEELLAGAAVWVVLRHLEDAVAVEAHRALA